MKNPKLKGSGIAECKPQKGRCNVGCNQCYYNRDPEYQSLRLFPKPDTKKIVRVNVGHDSNIDKAWVMHSTGHFKKRFFNTSIPFLQFPGPVVFTANRDEEKAATQIIAPNLMFVRLRVSSSNLELIQPAVAFYTCHNIPVVLTYMAYYSRRPAIRNLYSKWKKRNKNYYWCPKESFKRAVLKSFDNSLVSNCGNLCKDCGNCKRLFEKSLES